MARNMTRLILVCLMLPACSTLDMQGTDPRAYYEKNPIKNKVVTRTETHLVAFEPGATTLSRGEKEHFRDAVNQRSMMAVDSIMIDMPKAELYNSGRRTALERMMKYMGYSGGKVRFKADDGLTRQQAAIHMTFADVVLPDCPDWRKAPNHNYSNTPHANFGCATETNLGLMVADPRDLQRGTGDLPPASSERIDRTIREWHSGRNFNSKDGGGSGESGGAPGAGGEAPNTTNIEPVIAQ